MKFFRFLKFLVMFAVFCFVAGYVVMHLWNWLMPALFGLKTITYWQALGLLVLCKILLGGFHKHGGGGGRDWKRRMDERWAGMSPEERERFRAGMRGWKGCKPHFGRRPYGGWPDGPQETTEKKAQ
jgi:hypothetical protein